MPVTIPDIGNLLQAGGTAAVILLLVYIVLKFANEDWVPGSRIVKLETRVDQLTAALTAKAEGERDMTTAFRELTAELRATREAWADERATYQARRRAGGRSGGTE